MATFALERTAVEKLNPARSVRRAVRWSALPRRLSSAAIAPPPPLTEPTWLSPRLQSAEDRTRTWCHVCRGASSAGSAPPPLGTAMRALGLVARRPGTLLRHRLLPPCGLARCCSSATTGAVPTRADPAIVSSSTAPGPIVVDSASGVVPGRPGVVADSAAGATPAAGTLASRQNRASRARR